MTATTKSTAEQSVPIGDAGRAAEPSKSSSTGGRKPAAEREHAFSLLAWLVDGASGAVEELRHSDLGLSEEFWTHVYAARREGLLAVRAAIDSALTRLEAESTRAAEKEERKSRRGSVKIT